MALLALIAATACGGTADDAEPFAPTTAVRGASTSVPPVEPPAPVGGLVAELGTNRLYVVDRGFGLALRNVTDAPVVLRSMRLDSPLFAPSPATEREVTLAPGQRLVLPLPYGAVRCDAVSEGVYGIEVVLADGRALRLDAPEEYEGAIARLHQRECAAADVLERVAIDFGDEWAGAGPAVSGELRLAQRHPGAAVAIDDAVGNVIFTLVVETAHPVLEVSDAAPVAVVPVTIRADRCDPHAVAEFKRPYVFLSWVAVGDGAPVPVELELTGGARDALDDLIAACSG